MKFLILLPLITLVSCATSAVSSGREGIPAASDKQYTWTKISEETPWPKSYNFSLFNINGRLWTIHSQGIWSSNNGTDWTKSDLSNPIGNIAFLDYVVFKGALYGIGHLEGNIEQFTFKSEIYRTTDMKRWETIAANSNLPKRFFYHPFVFENKIWIIGGDDKTTKFADIWNSPDGITWARQRDNMPFGPRSGSQIVEFKGKLFMLDNDVWSSSDGLSWELVTPEIVKDTKVFGYKAVVFDDQIWLLGCNRNNQFSSQVLTSSDGKTWESKDAPWSPRGGIAAAVFNDKIYMSGGKYGGTPDKPNFIYSNDLWTLSTSK